MPTPGIMYVGAAIKDPALDEATFDQWYNETHIPDVFAARNGPPAAFRFKNADAASRPFPHLCLYVVPDMPWVDSDALKTAKMDHSQLPAGRSHFELIDFDIRHYDKVQTFEGQIPRDGRVGGAIIAIAMEPGGEGAAADKELDDWYRLQHLDMLSTVQGYRRSTRYRLRAAPTGEAVAGKLGLAAVPRYLALHEYDSTDIPAEQIKLAVNTEWSKKAIGASKAFVRDVWVLTHEAGDAATKL